VFRRRFCVAETGSLYLCPRETQPGDTVAIFYGAQVPYILRKGGDCYTLIGEAYLQDMMVGEALKADPSYQEVLFSIE